MVSFEAQKVLILIKPKVPVCLFLSLWFWYYFLEAFA